MFSKTRRQRVKVKIRIVKDKHATVLPNIRTVADPETEKTWSYANCGLDCKRLEHTE